MIRDPYNLRVRQAARVALDHDIETAFSKSWVTEDQRHHVGDADDSEGLALSSRPPSPLTPVLSDSDSDAAIDSSPGFHPFNSHPPSPLTPLPANYDICLPIVEDFTLDPVPPLPTTTDACMSDIECISEPSSSTTPHACNIANVNSLPTATSSSKHSTDHSEEPCRPAVAENGSQQPLGIETLRQKERAKERKKEKRRAKAVEKNRPLQPDPRASVAKYHQQVEAHVTAFKAETLKIAKSGFIGSGSRRNTTSKRNHTVRVLHALGFKLIPWDGKRTILICDKQGRILAILAGQPDDPGWLGVIAGAMRALKKFRDDGFSLGAWKDKDLEHRRGNFLAVASGVSYGGGSTRPGNVVNTKTVRKLLDRVISNRFIIRIAGFQNGVLRRFAPKGYSFTRKSLKSLFDRHVGLRLNFRNSIYPMITFNCGPETAALEHEDKGNAAGLYCALTAVGKFNHKRGAHMILYNLKVYIEFPSGSSILLPSSTVTHGNTPIAPGEERFSITQYCPGGLLRWVHYGFQSIKSLLSQAGGRRKMEAMDRPYGVRWRWALGLFSKFDELEEDRRTFYQ